MREERDGGGRFLPVMGSRMRGEGVSSRGKREGEKREASKAYVGSGESVDLVGLRELDLGVGLSVEEVEGVEEAWENGKGSVEREAWQGDGREETGRQRGIDSGQRHDSERSCGRHSHLCQTPSSRTST